jgi:trimethylamine--corrinoid protein Co-methyltransferase
MIKRNKFSDTRSCGGINLGFLSEDEIAMIHQSVLEVLKLSGAWIEAEESQRILSDAGADVDFKTGIVKFPEWMVEDAIRSAPSQFFLYGRDDGHNVVIETNRVYMSTFGQGVEILDGRTGELRPSVKKDIGDSALVADALEEIDLVERTLTAGDKPKETAPLHEAEEVLLNTTKPMVYGPGNGYRAQKIIDMAALAAGGHEALRERPTLICNCCPTSPLKIDRHACNAIVACARSGIPCNVLSMVLAGMSGPITLAGSLVVYVAEILSGIILNQSVRKGAPVIFGGSSMVFDMQYLTTPMGSPEVALLNGASAKIAQYYSIPSWVAGG